MFVRANETVPGAKTRSPLRSASGSRESFRKTSPERWTGIESHRSDSLTDVAPRPGGRASPSAAGGVVVVHDRGSTRLLCTVARASQHDVMLTLNVSSASCAESPVTKNTAVALSSP